jgi:hypothetical protein
MIGIDPAVNLFIFAAINLILYSLPSTLVSGGNVATTLLTVTDASVTVPDQPGFLGILSRQRYTFAANMEPSFGDTASHPANPRTGQIYFNTDTNILENWDGASWVGAVDLADANAVTGILPKGNQEAQDLGGDLAGNTAAADVVALQGTGISGTAPLPGEVLTFTGGLWTPQAGGGGGGSNFYGAYASRPAAGNAGAIATFTDNLALQQVDTGSAWKNLILGSPLDEPPDAAALSAHYNNFGTSTLVSDANRLIFTPQVTAPGTDRFRGAGLPIVTLASFSVSCVVDFRVPSDNGGFGVAVHESATGKTLLLAVCVIPALALTAVYQIYFADDTLGITSSSNLFFLPDGAAGFYNSWVPGPTAPFKLRMSVSAGILLLLEMDIGRGLGWQTMAALPIAAFFTTAPDFGGIGAYVQTATPFQGNYLHLGFTGT